MHTGSSFEMNTNLQPRQPPPSSIGGQDAPSSLRRNESSRSILSMARDAVGSNLADELDDSYQSLHDSGGAWGDSRGSGASVAGKSGGGLGAALAHHKLKKQGSSNSSMDKDADAASTYSDFSTGRCYHDIAGKTSVLMEDKELHAKFQASLKEKGIRTGVGVKMALQEFVAEHVTDADVARFEAAKRQKELAAASGGGGQSVSSSRSLRERVGSLGSLLHGSRQSLMGSSTSVGDLSASLGHDDPGANASWNLSRSFDPALANTGIKKSESFNNLIGDALGKFGLAAEGVGAAAPPTDVVVGSSIMAGLRRLSGASTSSAMSQMTMGDASAQGTATSSHRQSQRGGTLSMSDAAATVAAMDLEGDYGDSSDEEGEIDLEGDLQLDNLPPRAAERKRRASFGSLGALSMQKNFIDELSDEDDSSLSSSDDEEEVKPNSITTRNNHSNKTNGDIRSKDGTHGLDSDEDSDYDDDKEYLGDELMVGFGRRPSKR